MEEMYTETRLFTRVPISMPLEIHQGGSVWQQQLIDISFQGLTTDSPGDWDAQYNEPFTVLIKFDDGRKLELLAYLQNVEQDHLGFSLGHLDIQSKETMRQLLAPHMDAAALEWEYKQLSD